MTIEYKARHTHDGVGSMIESIDEREYDDPLGIRAPRDKRKHGANGYHVGQMVDRVNRRRVGDPLGAHPPRNQVIYLEEVELDEPESFEDDGYEYNEESEDTDENNDNRVIIICNKCENGKFS